MMSRLGFELGPIKWPVGPHWDLTGTPLGPHWDPTGTSLGRLSYSDPSVTGTPQPLGPLSPPSLEPHWDLLVAVVGVHILQGGGPHPFGDVPIDEGQGAARLQVPAGFGPILLHTPPLLALGLLLAHFGDPPLDGVKWLGAERTETVGSWWCKQLVHRLLIHSEPAACSSLQGTENMSGFQGSGSVASGLADHLYDLCLITLLFSDYPRTARNSRTDDMSLI